MHFTTDLSFNPLCVPHDLIERIRCPQCR
jgi:hypothetical protein